MNANEREYGHIESFSRVGAALTGFHLQNTKSPYSVTAQLQLAAGRNEFIRVYSRSFAFIRGSIFPRANFAMYVIE